MASFEAFENMVTSIVKDMLPCDTGAEFFSGTLFVYANEDVARKVFHRLGKYCGIGHIRVTKITDGEYACDFI